MNINKIYNLNAIKYLTYLLFFILLSYRILICFSFKHELCNGESNNIWTIVNVATNNRSLYTDPEKLPIVIYPYTPISEYPIILFSKLLNEKSEFYIYNVTVIGRLFQLIMSLLTVFLIFRLCKTILKFTSFQSIFSAIIVFGLQLPTSMNIRPDASYFFLLVATIYSFLILINNFSYKTLYATSFLYVTAFFTKQDGLFLIIPIVYIMILKFKNFKSIIFLSIFTLINLSIFTSIFYYIYGFDFIKNAFLGIHNTSTLTQSINIFFRFTDFFWFNLIFGLLSSVYYLINKNKTQLHLLAIISIYYFLIAIILGSKLGSWINYFYPFLIFSTLLIIAYFNKKISFISVAFIFFILMYNSKIIYNYTYPYLKTKSYLSSYKSTFNNYVLLKQKLKIKPTEFILTPNILLRTFSYKNSTLINTEYYSYTKFKYENFIKVQNKKIKHIIFKDEELELTNYLISTFRINLSNYNKSKISDYNIYTIK